MNVIFYSWGKPATVCFGPFDVVFVDANWIYGDHNEILLAEKNGDGWNVGDDWFSDMRVERV